MTKTRTLLPEIRALSPISEEISPSPPSSYAPLVIRNYKIPLFTKFAKEKLKIDLFSDSMIFK